MVQVLSSKALANQLVGRTLLSRKRQPACALTSATEGALDTRADSSASKVRSGLPGNWCTSTASRLVPETSIASSIGSACPSVVSADPFTSDEAGVAKAGASL